MVRYYYLFAITSCFAAVFWAGFDFSRSTQSSKLRAMSYKNKTWGDLLTNDTSIRRFKIEYDKILIDELYGKLKQWKRLKLVKSDAFSYGTAGYQLDNLVDYWRTSFDWFKVQHKLNSFSHFKTTIQGIDIHFVWSKCISSSETRYLNEVVMLTETNYLLQITHSVNSWMARFLCRIFKSDSFGHNKQNGLF